MNTTPNLVSTNILFLSSISNPCVGFIANEFEEDKYLGFLNPNSPSLF
jgi:hypothetical protein